MSERTNSLWYEDADCQVYIETYEGMTFLHCTIHSWTKEHIKKYKDILAAVCAELKEQGTSKVYAYNRNQDAKWEKFCKMFGFAFLGTAENGWKIYRKEC